MAFTFNIRYLEEHDFCLNANFPITGPKWNTHLYATNA